MWVIFLLQRVSQLRVALPGRCGRAVTANTDQVRKTKQKSLTFTKKSKMISVAFQKKQQGHKFAVPLVESSSNLSEIPQVSASTAPYRLRYQRQRRFRRRGMFSGFDARRAPSQTRKPGEDSEMWGLFRGSGRRLNDRAGPWLDILHALRRVRWRAVSFGHRDRITKAERRGGKAMPSGAGPRLQAAASATALWGVFFSCCREKGDEEDEESGHVVGRRGAASLRTLVQESRKTRQEVTDNSFYSSESQSRFLSYLLNLSSIRVLKDCVRYEKPAPSLHLLETHPPFICGFNLITSVPLYISVWLFS